MKERRCRATGCWKDQRGFTLVELILTIAILAIVTIPILSYFTDAAKHNARSRQKQNASVLAQDVLEEFKNTSYALDDPDVVCSAQPDWTVAASPDADGAYTLTQNKDMDNNSFKVTAQIKPLNKVVPAATAIPKNYEKYVIGTMDSSKDVMSSEHGQTLTSASYAFANKHSAAYAAAPAASGSPMSADELKENLDCSIIISAKEDSAKPGNDIISVKYKYTYNKGAGSYPIGIDASTVYEDVVESASINVKKLENIYLFYQPVNERDQIILETNDGNAIQMDANNLNLFVIAQNSVPSTTSDSDVPSGYIKRSSGYNLTISGTGSGFESKIAKLYLNLSKNENELNSAGTIAGKAQTDPTGEYTLVHSESINRVADITVTVDSEDGSKTGIVQVNGSKVQN